MERDTAIQKLYEQEYERLCHAACRSIGDLERARDLVQDTFLLALLHQEDLPDHPAPGAWLMETLKNLIRNERRRLASHQTVSLDVVEETVSPPPASSLRECLPPQLPEQDYKILVMRFEYRMSSHEIAEYLGISDGACRMRIFRAVEKCRNLYSMERPVR